MGRFIEDNGARLFFQRLQRIATPFRLRRQKTFVAETIRRQPRRAQRRNRSAGAGQRHHADIGLAAGAHQMVTGIVNQRRSGIGNQGDVLPLF